MKIGKRQELWVIEPEVEDKGEVYNIWWSVGTGVDCFCYKSVILRKKVTQISGRMCKAGDILIKSGMCLAVLDEGLSISPYSIINIMYRKRE